MMKKQTGSILIPILIALVLFVGASVSLVSTGVLPSPLSSPGPVSSTPQPTQQPISLEQISIDQITIANITSSPNLKQTENLEDGSTRYRLYSPLSARDDIAIFKDNQLLFYRQVKLDSDQTLPTITGYKLKYGEPQHQLLGSSFYGSGATLLLYTAQGRAVIGNTNTNEIYEEQTFKSTDLNGYLSQFGNDYLPATNSVIEEKF